MSTQSSTAQQIEQTILKDDFDHVLVMRPDTISDVVMLSPALRTLRETLPQSEITLLTSEAGSQVTPLVPWVDDVMVYPEAWKDITETTLLNLRKDMGFIERLRNQRFSAAVIFTSINQSPWPAVYACYLAGIPYRVGFAKDFAGSALSHCSSPPADALQANPSTDCLSHTR